MITLVAPSLFISARVSLGSVLVFVRRIGALYFAASGTPASASAELSPYARTTVFAVSKLAFDISAAVAKRPEPA